MIYYIIMIYDVLNELEYRDRNYSIFLSTTIVF